MYFGTSRTAQEAVEVPGQQATERAVSGKRVCCSFLGLTLRCHGCSDGRAKVGAFVTYSSPACGFVAALLYSAFGVVIEKARGAEDDLNTVAAGTMTGMLYKSAGDERDSPAGASVRPAVQSTAWLASEGHLPFESGRWKIR